MAISGFTVLMVFFTAFGGICVFNSVVFIAKAEVDVKAEDEMAISAEPMMGPSENPKPTHFKGPTLTKAHLVERHQ